MVPRSGTPASRHAAGPEWLVRAGMRGVSLAGAAALHAGRELLSRSVALPRGLAPTGAPDPGLAVARYRELARSYDLRTATGGDYRQRAVRALAPGPGETIIDVGCGSGLNFALIERGIGPDGRLIGLDVSPEMLDQAHERVEEQGWANVELLLDDAREARMPARADAALLCGVHDVMRSPVALANVLGQLVDGGRVVAAGPKWAPWWRPDGGALNLSTWAMNRDYVTTFEGFERPWSHLAGLVEDIEVQEVLLGGGYVARGTARAGRVTASGPPDRASAARSRRAPAGPSRRRPPVDRRRATPSSTRHP
jgi:SAM-dependent methyltransferase